MAAKGSNRKPWYSVPHLLLRVDGSSEKGKIRQILTFFQALFKEPLIYSSLISFSRPYAQTKVPIFSMCASFLRQFLRPGLLRAQPIRPTPSFPLQTLARPTPAIQTLTFHRTLRTSATRRGRMPQYCRACKCDGDCSGDSFSTIFLTISTTFFFAYLAGSSRSLQTFLERMNL